VNVDGLFTPAEIARDRAEAESRMLDTWAIGTDGGWRYDEGLGRDVQTVVPLFTTKGRLTERGATVALETQAGERTVIESRRELHIPWDSPNAPVNALAQCTAIDEATSDPTMLNVIVRLAGPSPASQKTARRLEVVEVLS
jgi:hypothetical protein